MKILIINKYDKQGGAAIAAFRLLNAINKYTESSVKMLVDVKQTENKNVAEYSNSFFANKMEKILLYIEKFGFMFYEKSKKYRFSFSTTWLGKNITGHKLVKEADIIHIHWVNHSFLNSFQFKKLLNLNKKIFITMHDMWYFTGGCHYTDGCENYMSSCGECKFLAKPNSNDLSNQEFLKKQKIYKNVTFIACSKWLKNTAHKSALLQNNTILNIPNPIDVNKFNVINKKPLLKKLGLSEHKSYLLYLAVNVTDERKGYFYLKNALELAKQQNLFDKLEVIVIGKDKNNEVRFPFKTHKIGYISSEDKLIDYYNVSDVFLSPSLEDNLPNTIMESMACGTPCVAFNIGGISDLVDHKENGYLAKEKNYKDLLNGINWVLNESNNLSVKARQKVELNFSEEKIAEQTLSVYNNY